MYMTRRLVHVTSRSSAALQTQEWPPNNQLSVVTSMARTLPLQTPPLSPCYSCKAYSISSKIGSWPGQLSHFGWVLGPDISLQF